MRAMVMNFGMLTTYDQIKEFLIDQGVENGPKLWTMCGLLCGVVCSFLSLPFDNLKTKLMKMTKYQVGDMKYNGIFDCFVKSVKREGFLKLWVGYPAYYTRVAPHALITMFINDLLYKL